MVTNTYEVKALPNSIKFYLPRVEGYLDVVREIASRYGSMSLIEFDGYFEGKFEPIKYTRVEVHTICKCSSCQIRTKIIGVGIQQQINPCK
jgi:hypothetical protein